MHYMFQNVIYAQPLNLLQDCVVLRVTHIEILINKHRFICKIRILVLTSVLHFHYAEL